MNHSFEGLPLVDLALLLDTPCTAKIWKRRVAGHDGWLLRTVAVSFIKLV
jgi:hypothetical protein